MFTSITPLYKTHISEVLTYKKCRRLWNWSARDRHNLEPRKAYSPFFIGSAVHFCIEQLYAEGTHPTSSLAKFLRVALRERRKSPLWPIDRDSVRTDVLLVRAMLAQYLIWARRYKGPFNDDSLVHLAHEQSFGDDEDSEPILLKINGEPLKPYVAVAGKFDGVVEHRETGRLLLPEYKTCRSIKERSALLPHDEQATLYVYAAQEVLGEKLGGVLYTLIRKKAAAQPKVLANGMLSLNKNIDTTAEMYLEAIKGHHGPVSKQFVRYNYGEILDYLRAEREPFIARVVIERTKEQVDRFVRELHATVLEMNDPATFQSANRTWTCPHCFFRQPCLALDEGDEDRVDMLLEQEYQHRPEHDDIEDELLSE